MFEDIQRSKYVKYTLVLDKINLHNIINKNTSLIHYNINVLT